MDNIGFAELLEKLYGLEKLSSPFVGSDDNFSYGLLSEAISTSAIPGLIGKTAIAKSDKVYFDGENPCIFFIDDIYKLSSIKRIVSDVKGNLIYEFKDEDIVISQGKYQIICRGINDNGILENNGVYRLNILAEGKDEMISKPEIFIQGEISQMIFNQDGVFFKINNLEIAYDSLVEIMDF